MTARTLPGVPGTVWPWTEADETCILDALRDRSPQTATTLAQAAGRNLPETRQHLPEMAERGLVMRVHGIGPVQWGLAALDVDPRLVYGEPEQARILSALLGRREMSCGLAALLGLDQPRVLETCKHLTRRGRLDAVRVGEGYVFGLESTHLQRQAGADFVLPVSPDARLLAQLAALPAERPIRTAAPRSMKPTIPKPRPQRNEHRRAERAQVREAARARGERVRGGVGETRTALLTALVAAGPEGLSGPEIRARLHLADATMHGHLKALGDAVQHFPATRPLPHVWRAAEYRDAPTPTPRVKVQPTRGAADRLLGLIQEGGVKGRTARELAQLTGLAGTNITRALAQLGGEVQRCRAGTSSDPTIYRSARHAASAPPAPRPAVRKVRSDAALHESRPTGPRVPTIRQRKAERRAAWAEREAAARAAREERRAAREAKAAERRGDA